VARPAGEFGDRAKPPPVEEAPDEAAVHLLAIRRFCPSITYPILVSVGRVVGGDGLPLETFFRTPTLELVSG